MTRLNTRKSRRSPESVDSKIVFDDEDPPVIIGEQILPHDDWVVVNQKLKDSGWSWSNGYCLILFLYKKPGIHEIKGKRLNIDYFTEEDHVKEYAKVKYGWLDITDTTYDDNAFTDDNSVLDVPDSTTPSIMWQNWFTNNNRWIFIIKDYLESALSGHLLLFLVFDLVRVVKFCKISG